MSLCNKVESQNLRNLLPKFIQKEIPEEEVEWKRELFIHVPKAISKGVPSEIDFWFNRIDFYNTLETCSYEISEMEKMFEILYNFIVTSEDMQLVLSAMSLLISMIEPEYTNLNVKIDWRKLYNLLYESSLTHSKTKVKNMGGSTESGPVEKGEMTYVTA